MSRARDLADLLADKVIQSDVSVVANSLPITNFIYGTEDTPTDLPDGNIYIKVDTEA